MNQGTVKWFESSRGYGFIAGDDNNDVFAHWSCISGDGFRNLEADQRVSYDIEKTDRGLRATNITVIYEA